ncbi:histone-lysine N-methyltransferase SETMAR [Plakobranchus ocellatus]|uniref:Histone-lysine N-methyltransferase SETMAR n=1 Tax=Plakobranchus ocellatus TaxID=259542 RepID=A0AAV4CXU6_9GAST|nr:histone-lysine N-methyltransferase SETMAR [Plakobranchus ocellatus]
MPTASSLTFPPPSRIDTMGRILISNDSSMPPSTPHLPIFISLTGARLNFVTRFIRVRQARGLLWPTYKGGAGHGTPCTHKIPDLAPTDFHLFGPLRRHLGGIAFEREDDLISELRNWFDNLDVDFFRVGINSLLSRWQKCIDLHGDYVEK